MRHPITTLDSLYDALTAASSGDILVCQNESMQAHGERALARQPVKELTFEVDVEYVVGRNFDRLYQLMKNFPRALKSVVATDPAMARSLENLLVYAREALEE
jgi:hypothetical protein